MPRGPRTSRPVMKACQYCGVELEAYRIPNHESNVCAKRPEGLAILAELLSDPDDPAVAIGYATYNALAKKDGDLPSVRAIVKAFGSWVNVVHVFGLVTRDEAAVHYRGLLPATVEELHRLSKCYYDGEVGPNHSDYAEYADRHNGAQAADTLKKYFHNWTAVLSAAGLQHESATYYWQAREQRRQELKAAKAAAAQLEDALNAPLGRDETLTGAPEIPQRPVPVIAAHRLPGGGMLYRLPKLPDDWAPRAYGIAVAAITVTNREERYMLR
jgi:hypothetical protein